jgi:hypothetical protein
MSSKKFSTKQKSGAGKSAGKKIIPHLLKKSSEIKQANLDKISSNIEKCGGDINVLASLCGLCTRTIYSHFKNPDNKSLLDKFTAQQVIHGTHPDVKEKKLKEEIAEGLKKFGGSVTVTSENINRARAYVATIINSDDNLKKIRAEEKEKKRIMQEEEIKNRKAMEEEKKNAENYLHDEIDETKFLKHQLEFANLKPDEVKHPALVGGFGCGKTMAIPLRWLKLIEFRESQNKNCELMILEPTYTMVQDILLPLFDEFFETLNIKTKWSATHRNYSIYYRGKLHTAKLRSADKPRSLTGKNLTDFIVDEFDKIPYYKQKVLWRECISRIRRAEFGTGAVVTTPEGFKMTYELWGKC